MRNSVGCVDIPIEEYEAVRAAIQRYVVACQAADHIAVRAALHPKWTMSGVDAEATDAGATLADFVSWVAEHSPPDGYRATITHLDIAGDAASATLVEESYYGVDYVIFFTLVRYDREWAIMTKTYSQVPFHIALYQSRLGQLVVVARQLPQVGSSPSAPDEEGREPAVGRPGSAVTLVEQIAG